VRKARRSLIWLVVIIAALVVGNAASAIFSNGSWTPKLALDLEGGTQIILAPQLAGGEANPSGEQLSQAVSIIRQRVDASGVSEAEINTQGGSNIVVSIPGRPDEETLNRIEQSAKLEFRPVLVAGPPTPVAEETPAPDAAATPAPDAAVTPAPDAAATPAPDAAATPAPDAAEPAPDAEPAAEPTDGSDLAWVTPAVQESFDSYDCASAENDNSAAPADQPLITCEADGSVKYILGPVEVAGERITDATSGLQPTAQGGTSNIWAVNIEFDGQGTEQFGEVSTRLVGLEGAQNQFAIVLDGQVISAPRTEGAVTNGKPSITGSFTQETAKTLADQLKFGALPFSFTVQSSELISATLGSTQLASGLLAGAIGLILVVLYSLVQYRALASVTIASLIIAGIVTYLVITLMSWREGYRLSLAGVAGLIVAIGITADSFIVYFERIKDELRDGRGLASAVESGWKRAIRTVLASDTVNFLAAAVLFVLAVGNVRGFALTLGLTTLIDLLVVALFTHPILQLLANTRFFSEGHRMSGLDPRALGAVYRGRATFREPAAAAGKKPITSTREAEKRRTIAERKAEEASLVSASRSSKSDKDS
jgi:preprotein translocase subunit SecD